MSNQRAINLVQWGTWSIKVSYLLGGLMIFYVIIAIFSSHYIDPWHAPSHREVAGTTAAWHAAIICVGAWLIFYKLIPGLLMAWAIRIERAWAIENDRDE
jgi:hypothetical protein